MDSYNNTTPDTLRPLDFTSTIKHSIKQEEDYEAPVLDLSVKTQAPTTSTVQYEPHLNSPSNSEKSPFEGRSFMVTPPSESDSPKKTKYEPIRNYLSMAQHGGCFSSSMVPIPANLPIPIPITPIVQPITPPALIPTILPTSSSHGSTSFKSDDEGSVKDSANASADSIKKAPRPFKAYPKDPLSLAMGPAEMIYDPNSNEAYSEFRKRMLESVRKTNEGTNVKMRRVSKSPGIQGSQPTSTQDDKDAAYWERRRKNNEAAKRSRDARRAKEDEIAIRAAFLEQENMKLKYELVALRNETAKLRCMVYST